MTWTKRQLIEGAFNELGLGSYTFDIQPDQQQAALRQLDSMVSTWKYKGVSLGYVYPTPTVPSDLDTNSGILDDYAEAIILNLAIKIAPSFGKTLQVETKISAKMAYDAILAVAAMPGEMSLPKTLPSGAGNKLALSGGNFIVGPGWDSPLGW